MAGARPIAPLFCGAISEDGPGKGEAAMSDKDDRAPARRQYPPFYEKVVPIVLALIALVVIALLLVILGVALGLFPGVVY